jgi:hypothetical protein
MWREKKLMEIDSTRHKGEITEFLIYQIALIDNDWQWLTMIALISISIFPLDKALKTALMSLVQW